MNVIKLKLGILLNEANTIPEVFFYYSIISFKLYCKIYKLGITDLYYCGFIAVVVTIKNRSQHILTYIYYGKVYCFYLDFKLFPT